MRSQQSIANWKAGKRGSISRGKRSLNMTDTNALKFKDREVVLGLLIPFKVTGGADLSGYSGGEYYAAAFMLAIEDINNRTDLLPHIKLRYVWNDTMCLVDLAIKSQIWQHCTFQSSERTGVDAFIGTGCKCATAARNAAALNLPIISHVSEIIFYDSMFHFCGKLWTGIKLCCYGSHSMGAPLRSFRL